jgi:hypothetical protein
LLNLLNVRADVVVEPTSTITTPRHCQLLDGTFAALDALGVSALLGFGIDFAKEGSVVMHSAIQTALTLLRHVTQSRHLSPVPGPTKASPIRLDSADQWPFVLDSEMQKARRGATDPR